MSSSKRRALLTSLRRLSALPLLALPLALLVSMSPASQRLSDLLDDALLRWTAQPLKQQQLLLVDLDDTALAALQPQLGSWPYSRDVYALLIEYLREAGAKLVVLDIVFEAGRPGDARLAEVLAAKSDVVLAAAALRQAPALDSPAQPLPDATTMPAGLQLHRWPAVL
ncbi:MAG TPA: CHASE2 domain-containing protein, partial [Burkholderiaceae bacterium]